MPDWLRELDHTADAGIAVSAPDLDALFVRAAEGFFRMLTDLEDVAPEETTTVSIEAEDRADLLLRWLSELNYLHVTRGLLFSAFEIRERTDTRLVAVARGEAIDPARHVVYTEIKAVTYHGLTLEEGQAGWTAQVICDL